MMQKLFHYASPQTFYPLAGKLWPVFAVLAALGAMPGGQGTTTQTSKPGLLQYLAAGATALGGL